MEDTPLDSPEGSKLVQGLNIHTVHAKDDGHPLAVYTVNDEGDGKENQRTPVLLLHGRTWSSVPVYHLAEDANQSQDAENRSLIEALYNRQHIQPYSMDFRGFGGTPKDESGYVEPLQCVSDALSVLNWIDQRHSDSQKPSLLGWSHGALIAQITAQRHPRLLSSLILYGSIYNPNIKYSIPPPRNSDVHDTNCGHTDHDDFPLHAMAARNCFDGAMEDFTRRSCNEARAIFPPASARLFARSALTSDPIKAKWWNLHQLNECHPSLVKVPTMVIAGDDDPYAPTATQSELFTNLRRGVDRSWCIISNADHAVHLSDERGRFVESVSNFLSK